MAARIEQSIFKTIVQMANEMELADQMNQAKTRLLTQVNQAFEGPHEWIEVLTYDDEECDQHNIDLDAEHPYIDIICIRIRHWVAEKRLEVDTLIHPTSDAVEAICEDTDYYYDGSLYEGIDQVESAVVEHLTTLIDEGRDHMRFMNTNTPLIREEVDRQMAYVEERASRPRPAPEIVDGISRVGSISFHTHRLPMWMFNTFMEEHPHIEEEHIREVVKKAYPHVRIPY